MNKVKNNFTHKKYSGTDCLSFEQIGEDSTANGIMNINNEGMVCVHPASLKILFG